MNNGGINPWTEPLPKSAPNKGLELPAYSVRSYLAPAASRSSGLAFGSETQQHLSTTVGGPNLTEYGLNWSQHRQNIVKIYHLQRCIVDSQGDNTTDLWSSRPSAREG
jgi:hypothetical protein